MINKDTLPKGWIIAKFEDLLDYIQPTNYIVKSTEYKDTYKTPVLTAGKSFIKGYTNETDGIFNQLPTIIFDDFTTATQFVNFPFKVKSSAMKILQPTCDLVNIKLAYYFMQIQNIKGETHKRFWISEYSQLPVPLAPLNEQKRIIDKIEELITDLDKGIEYLETSKQQLKVYRQSVLKWAFEGKLTSSKTEKWQPATLNDVCSLITDGKHGDCVDEVNSGYYFLSAKDVRNNTLLYKDARQITKKDFEETHRRTNLKPGDICLVNTGATIGRLSIAPKDDKTYKTTFQKSVAVIKCIPDLIDTKFVCYLLKSDLQKLVKVSGGSAIPNLLLGTIKKHKIIYPVNLLEQEIIVKEIESRLSVCDKIEETIENTLLQAEALRLSIIKRAFEGKLVPQNPSDVPAEKLLEKIRAAKGKDKPEKKEKVKTKSKPIKEKV